MKPTVQGQTGSESGETLEAQVTRAFAKLIADLAQCDPQFIRRFSRRAKSELSGVRLEKMAEMWREGKSIDEIAKAFGIDGNAVRADVWRAQRNPALAILFPTRGAARASERSEGELEGEPGSKGQPVQPLRKIQGGIFGFELAGDYFEMPADSAPKYNTLYVRARRQGWAVRILRSDAATVRVIAVARRSPESHGASRESNDG